VDCSCNDCSRRLSVSFLDNICCLEEEEDEDDEEAEEGETSSDDDDGVARILLAGKPASDGSKRAVDPW
jgi:hypothetical protein